MTSIILDSETLNTTPSSIITEIAVIAFNRLDQTVTDHLVIRPDFFEQLTLGRSWSADTIAFHRKRGTLPGGEKETSVFQTVAQIEAFIQEHNPHRVWIQGTCFDRPLVEDFFNLYHRPLPWPFVRSSDVRTIYDVAMRGEKHPRRPHKALEDCQATLADLVTALKGLNRLDEI